MKLLVAIFLTLVMSAAFFFGRAIEFEKNHKETWEKVLAEATFVPSPTVTPSPSPAIVATTVSQKPSEPKVTCTGPDGKTFQATQKECDEFNKAWGTSSQPTQAPSQNIGSSYSYTPKTYYSCTLCYHYSYGDSCSTYNYLYENKEQCDAAQAENDAIVGFSGSNYYVTPAPTTKPDYSQQNSQCKRDVNLWWTNVGSQYGAGTREAIKQIEYPNYQAKLAACDAQWPL